MPTRRFIQCDVFTSVPTLGNALAVVLDGEGLSDSQMAQFAAWTNLAETTFLLPPQEQTADYRVRIFTPTREMPFAGHPTLGSCAAWLHGGGRPRSPGLVRQECAIGIVEIDTSRGEELAFSAPPTEIRALSAQQLARITAALEVAPASVLGSAELDNGPVWQVLQLDSAASVLAVDSARVRWPEFQGIGLLGAHPPGAGCDYEVRMLAPSSGMREDPITGSLNAALAHWLHSQGRLTAPVSVAQGTSIGRQGRVSIRPGADAASIRIGGQVHLLIEGTLTL